MSNSLYQLRVKNRRGVVTLTAVESASPSKRYVKRQLQMTPAEYDTFIAEDGVTEWLEGIIPVRTNPR